MGKKPGAPWNRALRILGVVTGRMFCIDSFQDWIQHSEDQEDYSGRASREYPHHRTKQILQSDIYMCSYLMHNYRGLVLYIYTHRWHTTVELPISIRRLSGFAVLITLLGFFDLTVSVHIRITFSFRTIRTYPQQSPAPRSRRSEVRPSKTTLAHHPRH
jgi:hypothetical protein